MDREKVPADDGTANTIYRQEPTENAKLGADEKVEVWIYAGRQPAVPAAGVQRPYYAVFQIVFPFPKDKESMPKKGENESGEAYKSRLLAFLRSLGEDDLVFNPVPIEQGPFVMHVSSDAIEPYPRTLFTKDGKFACKIDAEGKNAETGKIEKMKGVFLLKAVDTYESMSGVLEAHAVLKAKEDLDAMAFTDANGKATVREEQGTFIIGPITKDWKDTDIQGSMELLAAVLAAFDCFIATVVYVSPMSHEVNVLREFRDEVLLRSEAGAHLAGLYYIHGPGWAAFALRHPEVVPVVRGVLDRVVLLIEHTDLDDPVVRSCLDAAIACADGVLSLLLGERGSTIGEFHEALMPHLAPHKMSLVRPGRNQRDDPHRTKGEGL